MRAKPVMVGMTKAEAIALEEYRRAHVPLYNDQKLKLAEAQAWRFRHQLQLRAQHLTRADHL
jgi:hypothetical protein